VEQLNLLDPPRHNHEAAIWNALDDQQKAAVIATLVRLMIQVARGTPEQEHQHE
jgi:predicted Fe-S protein YdhL (DUF1289 family)